MSVECDIDALKTRSTHARLRLGYTQDSDLDGSRPDSETLTATNGVGLVDVAGHESADMTTVSISDVEHRDDPAVVHHADTVSEAEHLIELGGDQQHRRTAIAGRHDL